MNRNEHKYDDIIHLPHHVSTRHPQMPLSDRAAQFSPFAALTGHEEAIHEAARLTDTFVELSEDKKQQLDEQLSLLWENMSQQPLIEVTYFQPDLQKDGGSYVTFCGQVKKIDTYNHQILFTDKTSVPMDAILSIEGTLFENWDPLD